MKFTIEQLREKGFVEMTSGNWIRTTTGGNAELIEPSLVAKPEPPKPPKRIRQSSKPLMNRLETEFAMDYLQFRYPKSKAQYLKFKLANGVTFTPDFVDLSVQPVKAWEVKGKHAWDDALVKLKVAAKEWPEVRWVLAWKENGEWKQQEILP